MHQVSDQLLVLLADVSLEVGEHTLCKHLKSKTDRLLNQSELLTLLLCQIRLDALRPTDLHCQECDLGGVLDDPCVEFFLLRVSI